MTQTIVVPLDQSEIAERALPVAQALAGQLDAQLHLISILEVSPDYDEWLAEQALGDEALGEPWRSIRKDTEAYLAGIADSLNTPEVSTEIRIGVDSAVEIDATVSEMDDAILVLTSQGRSGFERLILGSKTTRLVQLASYPLIIIPAKYRVPEHPDAISRVLLALDGSSFAEYALQVTFDVFPADELSFHLLRVVDPIEAIDTDILDRARDYLSHVADRLRADGHTVDWEVDIASASDVANRIAVFANAAESDLISVATHGRTGFSRWYFGSVTDDVLRRATKPVLVVHPSEDVIARAPESRSRRARES